SAGLRLGRRPIFILRGHPFRPFRAHEYRLTTAVRQPPTQRPPLRQKCRAVACLTPLSLPTSSSTAGGAAPSIDTSAIAEPPSSSRPKAKVAILTSAAPRTLANRPMKPGLSSLVT